MKGVVLGIRDILSRVIHSIAFRARYVSECMTSVIRIRPGYKLFIFFSRNRIQVIIQKTMCSNLDGMFDIKNNTNTFVDFLSICQPC